MKTYGIFRPRKGTDVRNAAGSDEQAVCEIYAVFENQSVDGADYVAVEASSHQQTFEILANEMAATIEIDPNAFGIWRNTYREICATAMELQGCAYDQNRQGIVVNAEKLADLLESAPELGEYDLTDAMGVDRCMNDLSVEQNAFNEILDEIQAIFNCTITRHITTF
jgi:hypothetical protein